MNRLPAIQAVARAESAGCQPNNGSQRGDEVADPAPTRPGNPQRSTLDRDEARRKIAEPLLNGDHAEAERQTLRTFEIGLRCYNDSVSREALAWIRRRLGRQEARPP